MHLDLGPGPGSCSRLKVATPVCCLHASRQFRPLPQLSSVSFFLKNRRFAWRADQWPFVSWTLWSSFASQHLLSLRLGPMKCYLSWHCALQGPSTRLVASVTSAIQGYPQAWCTRHACPRVSHEHYSSRENFWRLKALWFSQKLGTQSEWGRDFRSFRKIFTWPKCRVFFRFLDPNWNANFEANSQFRQINQNFQ